MIRHGVPALVFAPMDGITDAAMRMHVGSWGVFTYAVTEFIRVSQNALQAKTFRRDIPELAMACRTSTGLPVQIQLLGGDPERMALSAMAAVAAGVKMIDINFGCPAPTVNRNDGGASLLRFPSRIEEVVRAVREATPPEVPVSAKLRLGWEEIDDIHETASRAVNGGASWITIHARTKKQGYQPPVFWPKIGDVRAEVGVPVIANGDIFSIDDFQRCRDETGCIHFMIGRGALARPKLAAMIAKELGISAEASPDPDWKSEFRGFLACERALHGPSDKKALLRLKQWASIAHKHGQIEGFDRAKRAATVEEFLFAIGAG